MEFAPFILAGVSASAAIAAALSLQKRRIRQGLASPIVCPTCEADLPVLRVPTSPRQMLYGGWTCQACGCELNRHGLPIEH